MPAGELQVGDLLISHDDQLIEVTEVRSTDEVTTVYNLRVADHHTYFVGGTIWGWDVWVHNASYGGRMNGATATVESGGISVRLRSKNGVHSEIRGLQKHLDDGTLMGQHVVIRDVVGHFPAELPDIAVGVCAKCRTNMFDLLIEGGAKSISIPFTRGKEVRSNAFIIARENFAKARIELKQVLQKYENSNSAVRRSNEVYDVLRKYST